MLKIIEGETLERRPALQHRHRKKFSSSMYVEAK